MANKHYFVQLNGSSHRLSAVMFHILVTDRRLVVSGHNPRRATVHEAYRAWVDAETGELRFQSLSVPAGVSSGDLASSWAALLRLLCYKIQYVRSGIDRGAPIYETLTGWHDQTVGTRH